VTRLAPAASLAALLAVTCCASSCVTESHRKYDVTAPQLDATREPVDFELTSFENEPVFISRYRGNVVLVDLFATWCLPCMKLTPAYVQLHHQYADRGFTVIGVGLDDQGPRVIEPYIEYHRVPYPVFLPSLAMRDGVTVLGPLTALPFAVLLDRKGRIVASFAGAGDDEFARLMRAVEKAVRDGM